MKTFYKTLIGFTSAIIVLIIINLIFYFFNIETNKFNFLTGWFSCLSYYIGCGSFEEWHSKH